MIARCIKKGKPAILIDDSVVMMLSNRGEDLRFPISSSSGFSSPIKYLTPMLWKIHRARGNIREPIFYDLAFPFLAFVFLDRCDKRI